MPGLKEKGLAVYQWFEDRLGLGKPTIEAMEHEVPQNTASWWYVFGSAATVLLVLQVVTGILLRLGPVHRLLAKHGRALSFWITPSSWAGFCAPCMVGDRTSWLPSC